MVSPVGAFAYLLGLALSCDLSARRGRPVGVYSALRVVRDLSIDSIVKVLDRGCERGACLSVKLGMGLLAPSFENGHAHLISKEILLLYKENIYEQMDLNLAETVARFTRAATRLAQIRPHYTQHSLRSCRRVGSGGYGLSLIHHHPLHRRNPVDRGMIASVSPSPLTDSVYRSGPR